MSWLCLIAGLSNPVIIEKITGSNYRHPCPPSCPKGLYSNVLMQCWNDTPEFRPRFAGLMDLVPRHYTTVGAGARCTGPTPTTTKNSNGEASYAYGVWTHVDDTRAVQAARASSGEETRDYGSHFRPDFVTEYLPIGKPTSPGSGTAAQDGDDFYAQAPSKEVHDAALLAQRASRPEPKQATSIDPTSATRDHAAALPPNAGLRTCQYTSGSGRACKSTLADGNDASVYCANHTCTASGCTSSASSQERYCTAHSGGAGAVVADDKDAFTARNELRLSRDGSGLRAKSVRRSNPLFSLATSTIPLHTDAESTPTDVGTSAAGAGTPGLASGMSMGEPAFAFDGIPFDAGSGLSVVRQTSDV